MAAGDGRDPWLDNVKMVLVTIVVVGHAVVLLPSSDLGSQAYDFIYYFHIPAFVLVTGYLSRSFRWNRRYLFSAATTLLIPYVVYEWAMVNFRVHVTHEVDSLDRMWLNPHWPMWYLIVLLMWRLLTPILKLHWVFVPIAVGVSLLAGLRDTELFDINRMLGLLPFFVLGLHLPKAALSAAKARWTGLLGVVVLLLIWQLAAQTDDHWGTQWLYYRASYDDLGATAGDGMWIRLRLMLIAVAGVLAVLSLVPRRRSFLSAMGAWTMVVYLLHGFVIRYVEAQDYQDWLPAHEWASLLVTVALAVLLAMLLASPLLARRLNFLVDPVNAVLALRRTADERRAPASDAPPSATPAPPGRDPRR
ncbi:acyltransferase family protein [Nocardioides sp. LHG3406-4]|uniref:acyltransferase family protein n=1 Tax=Nocardioides sp. LHG3406-4 TaxID=2804575 RepID=UPI003CF94C98